MSLSASENVLPSMGSEYATGGQVRTGDLNNTGGGGVDLGGGGMGRGGRRSRKGLVKAGVDWLGGWAGDMGKIIGVSRKERGF